MPKTDPVSGTSKASTKRSWPRLTDSRILCVQLCSAAPYPRLARGNIHVKAADEDGALTCAFFGFAHEGLGGGGVRDDLSGAFAGAQPHPRPRERGDSRRRYVLRPIASITGVCLRLTRN